MEQEYKEYYTFHITAKDGSDVEMAVVDEFEFEKKNYIVGAVIKDDEILDDGRYIYGYMMKDGEIIPQKIVAPGEYEKIAKAYMEME